VSWVFKKKDLDTCNTLVLHLNTSRGFRHVFVRVKLQLFLELIVSRNVLLYFVTVLCLTK